MIILRNQSISALLQNKHHDPTDQFAIVLDINVQNGHHETEDVFHVLGERLLDVSASLGGQRLEGDHILRQPQQDQHHQLRLRLLWKTQVDFSLTLFTLTFKKSLTTRFRLLGKAKNIVCTDKINQWKRCCIERWHYLPGAKLTCRCHMKIYIWLILGWCLFACELLHNPIQTACKLQQQPALYELLTPWLVRASISFSISGQCWGHSLFIISTVIRDRTSLMWLSSSKMEWVPW